MAAVPAGPLIVEDLWVQCDNCSKWRRLAPGTLVDENSNWYCWQHPDPNQKSCDTPEEAPQEGTISWKTVASLQGVSGKGRKRKAAPAAQLVQPQEPVASSAKAAESNACYAILRPLLAYRKHVHCSTPRYRLFGPGGVRVTTHVQSVLSCKLQEGLCVAGRTFSVADITVDDYEVVSRACPGSAPILWDALSLYSAMMYVPKAPDVRQMVMSAISACVLEARPVKME